MGYCAGQAAPHLPASLAGDPQIQELAQRLNAAETTIAVMRSQWDDALWLGRGIFGAVATLVADRVWIAFKARV